MRVRSPLPRLALLLCTTVGTWACAPAADAPALAPATSEMATSSAATASGTSTTTASAKADAPVTATGTADVAAPAASNTSVSEEPALPTVAITLEPPYVFGARPVPAAAIAASAYDTELGSWNQGGGSDPAFVTNRANYHAAVRVIVDTKPLLGKKAFGRLTPPAVQAQARRNGYWLYRLCFEEGLRKGQTQRGQSVLRFSIDVRGRVSYARRLRSELAPEVAHCLRRVTYDLRFQPAPARRVDVELTVSLSPGDAKLPPRDVLGTPPQSLGALPQWLEARTPEIAACFAEGRKRDPKLWGRLELQLARSAEGTLSAVTELHSRFPDAAMTRCAIAALLSAPPPENSGPRDSVAAWRLGVPPFAAPTPHDTAETGSQQGDNEQHP